jgi:hypothetical protein
MSIDKLLHEASAVLNAASRYSSELSEVGRIDHAIYRMRVLITTVAAHTYSSLGKETNIEAVVNELQSVKDVILRTAEQRFGGTSRVLDEFQYKPMKKTGT